MHDSDSAGSGGGPPRPFLGAESRVPPATHPQAAALPRPFVPGAPPPAEPALPPITQFLYDESHAPPRQPSFTPTVPPIPGYTPAAGVVRTQTPATVPSFAAMPSAPHEPVAAPAPPPRATPAPVPAPAPAPAPATGPWATGDWQKYDWRGAAALAPDDAHSAEQAWGDLDWDAGSQTGARGRGGAIADALEQVARRIRSGDIPVQGGREMTEEAAVAAALVALLQLRR